MKNLLLISLLLVFSQVSLAQTFLEVSNQSVSFRSKDKLLGGELTSNSNFNPKISGRLSLYRTNIYSIYVDGSSSFLNFNKDNFNNTNQTYNQFGFGFRLRPASHLSMEILFGYKEVPTIYSANGVYFIDKQGHSTIGMKGAIAIKQVGDVTLIGEGSGTYFIKKNGYNGQEVGIGLSVGSTIYGQYFKVGYRLEHESNYSDSVSNSLLKNSLYFKLQF